MRATCGDRIRIRGREGVVLYATPSSVRIRLGTEILDLHYPCDGPYRVLLNLIRPRQDDNSEDAEEIRQWAFQAFGISSGESWEMHVSLSNVECVRTGQGKGAPLPTSGRRLPGFLGGLAYLSVIALLLSAITGAPFWAALLLLFAGAVLVGGLAIWWLTLWASRKDGRWGQFGLGSLLFLTLFVSLYFGTIRALITFLPGAPVGGWTFLFVALFGLVPIALSLPFMLVMLDALLWAAVWLVKRFRGIRSGRVSAPSRQTGAFKEHP